VARRLRPPATLSVEKEINMRIKSLFSPRVLMVASVAASGLILLAGEASAARYVQQTHAGEYRIHKSSSPTDLFDSYANGRQSYENPDRQLYVWGD
jgi:hypothetical protein